MVRTAQVPAAVAIKLACVSTAPDAVMRESGKRFLN